MSSRQRLVPPVRCAGLYALHDNWSGAASAPQGTHEALQTRRQEQEVPAFRQAYQARTGVEKTISKVVRIQKLRRSRYDGLQRTQCNAS
ncbi:transposase [Dictyobacter halimunensis]|uniref:transposase n=1 Tax=Dictyobacter halimunensis TaxID=3026934 RepID=UPI003B97E656